MQAKLVEPLLAQRVEPIPTVAYPTAAQRPANSVLDCSKIEAVFGLTPRPWRESLCDFVWELYALNPYTPRHMLITGGAGFIGCHFVRHILRTDARVRVVTLDALTYAGSLGNLQDLPDPTRHTFVHGDICDRALVECLLHEYAIDTIVHFAAESHVDRSITDPAAFIQTNVVGTFTLLECRTRHLAAGAWLGRWELSLPPCVHR